MSVNPGKETYEASLGAKTIICPSIRCLDLKLLLIVNSKPFPSRNNSSDWKMCLVVWLKFNYMCEISKLGKIFHDIPLVIDHPRKLSEHSISCFDSFHTWHVTEIIYSLSHRFRNLNRIVNIAKFILVKNVQGDTVKTTPWNSLISCPSVVLSRFHWHVRIICDAAVHLLSLGNQPFKTSRTCHGGSKTRQMRTG